VPYDPVLIEDLAARLIPAAMASGRTVEQAVKYAFILAEVFAKEVEARENKGGETPVIK
jgi:hypothetical protein